jgi:hypothetical protein
MQDSVPEVTDLSDEPEYILNMYGPQVPEPGKGRRQAYGRAAVSHNKLDSLTERWVADHLRNANASKNTKENSSLLSIHDERHINLVRRDDST